MSLGLGDLGGDIEDLARAIGNAIVELAKSPWQLEEYASSAGAPGLGKDVLNALKDTEDGGKSELSLEEAIALIDGITQAIKRIYDTTNTGDNLDEANLWLEASLRFFMPIALVVTRGRMFENTASGVLYAVLSAILLIDDKLSDQTTGFTAERFVKFFAAGGGVAVGDEQRDLLGAMLLPTTIFAVCNLLGARVREPMLAAGWESERPPPNYGFPVEEPPSPVWMAQRTTSVHWKNNPRKLRLSHYDDPSTTDPDWGLGVTIVPVPASAGGPAMWVQFDGGFSPDPIELGNDLTVRVRGNTDAGTLIRLYAGERPPGASEGGVGGGIEAELTWSPPPPPDPKPDQGGESGGARVALGGASLIAYGAGGLTTNGSGPDDWGFGVRFPKLKLAVTPKSKVLGALLAAMKKPDDAHREDATSFTATFDLGLLYSRERGFVFEGSAGLDLYIPLKKSVGGGWLGATLQYLRLSAIVDKKPETARFGVQATFGLELSFLRAKLILDGLGAGLFSESRKPKGNLLGLADVRGDMITPSGIGLELDWGPVKGGGFFSHDKAKDRYSGVVEVSLGSQWILRGVGFTEPRDPTTHTGGTTTVVMASIEHDVPSPGFTLSGFGFLFGLHRRANAEAMRDALPTGAIDAVMFPKDPLGRSAELVQSLATMFPPAPADDDSHVFGLLLKGSFAKNYATVKVGFIFEFGRGSRTLSRVLVPFSLKAGPTGKAAKIFSLEVLGLGDYDPATGDLEIHAILRNSKLCGGDLVGGLVVFHGDPDPSDADRSRGTFISIGGYHPSYYAGKGPRRARVDDRLGIVIARGDSVRLEVQFYFAFTPSGFHLGFKGHLHAVAAGFGVDGQLWLDGVTSYTFDDFTLTVGGSVSLILFGETITELRLEGELTGQSPWNVSGSVSWKVLWWTVSKSFSKQLSDDDVDVDTVTQAIHEQLAAALTDPTNYPRTAPGAVMLARRQRDGVWNAPEQPLTLVQKVAPFETQIDRVGRTPLGVPLTIHLDGVTIDGTGGHELVTSEFAPAAYLSLDSDAAVRAPVAELWPAGFAAGDVVVAGDSEAVVAQLDQITVDRKQLKPAPKRILTFPTQILDAWRKAGVLTAVQPIRIRAAQFSSRTGDTPSTFSSAWAARGMLLRRTEGG